MSNDNHKLIDFVEKRKAVVENKRRNLERIVFNNMLGVYTVLDQEGILYPITLVDISYEGCLFSTPWNGKKSSIMSSDTELVLRMYFTKHSYVPVVVKIKYGREFIGKNGESQIHYGCEFDKTMASFVAMESFIEFMYRFAEYAAVDRGDTKAFVF
jgi:hypothetical protein